MIVCSPTVLSFHDLDLTGSDVLNGGWFVVERTAGMFGDYWWRLGSAQWHVGSHAPHEEIYVSFICETGGEWSLASERGIFYCQYRPVVSSADVRFSMVGSP